MATDSAEQSVDSGIPEVWQSRDKFDEDVVLPMDEDEECSTPQTRGAAFKRKGLFKKSTLAPPPRANAGSSSGYPGVSWNKRMGAWLAFYYDNDTRRSRTFHPKYYDMDVEKAKIAAIDFMKGIEKHPRCSLRKTRREPSAAAATATATTTASATTNASSSANGQVDSVRPLSPTLPSADQSLAHANTFVQHHSLQKQSCSSSTPSYRDVKSGRGASGLKRGHGSILRSKGALGYNGCDDLSSPSQALKQTGRKSPVFDYDVVKRNFMLVNTKALDNAFSEAATTTSLGAMTNTPDSSRRSFCNVEPGLYYDCGVKMPNNGGGATVAAAGASASPSCWPTSQVFMSDYFDASREYSLDDLYLQGHYVSPSMLLQGKGSGNPYFDQEISSGNVYLDHSRCYDSETTSPFMHGQQQQQQPPRAQAQAQAQDVEASELHRLMASVAPSGVDSFEGFKHVFSATSSPFGSRDIYGSLGYSHLNSSSMYQASPCPSLVALACSSGGGGGGESQAIHYASYPSFSNFVASSSSAAATAAASTNAQAANVLQEDALYAASCTPIN